jgi:hypothetical protein
VTAIRLERIGWKAASALGRSGGVARVLAPTSTALYVVADGEVLWLGDETAPLHGRAMLVPVSTLIRVLRRPPPDTLALDVIRAAAWGPPNARPASADLLADRCTALMAAIGRLGAPRGLGVLLAGRTPAFPLVAAGHHARALARAAGAGDAAAAVEEASALLGLGPGLTPAGDDYVGGVFFARRLVADTGNEQWRRAAETIVARARARTHPISATLLGDLCDGSGHAALHDLAHALVTPLPLEEALDAARRLAAIGHSSGWDMLAGFVSALAIMPAERRRRRLTTTVE